METRVPPPLLGLVIAGLIWLSAAAWPVAPSPPIALKAAGGAAIAFGLMMDASAVIAFLRRRTTVTPLRPEKAAVLVTDGWYRISRNPMYLGMALLLSGWSLVLAAPAGVLAVAAFVWWITEWQIKPEERALRSVFGAAYEAYCARVRRWI